MINNKICQTDHLISENEDHRTQHNEPFGKLQWEDGENERKVLDKIKTIDKRCQQAWPGTSAKPNIPTRERVA